jgi:hypothetical protein
LAIVKMARKIRRRTTMPAPLVVSVETANRDQVPPDVQADLPASPGQGDRQEDRGRVLRRVTNLLRRVPKAGASYYDPLFGRPDIVETDYYRFRHQPR